MSNRLGSVVARAGIVLVGLVATDPAPGQASDRAAGQASPESSPQKVPEKSPAKKIQPAKFDHDSHKDKLHPVTKKNLVSAENCASCHGNNPQGVLDRPAKSGHQPCMAGGCHARWFLGVAADTKRRDPVLYEKSVAFCLGCHDSPSGQPPNNYTVPSTDNLYRDNSSPDYHVEFNHFDHTQLAACQDCHVVDPSTFALKLDTPGHAQCAQCHGKEEGAQPMGECAACHREPGPAEYFHNAWKGSETRTCNSPAHLALAARRQKKPQQVPCFKHEREEHRLRRGRKPLDCGHCHFMIGDRRRWGSNRYETVRDIKSAPIIHNSRDLAHASCGDSRACHRRDVDDRRGTANCLLCHSQKTIDNDLFEP
ncbi:MAG: cytochrome c family protein [Proteobacteria bacterium]|nr:cytochrome c family protein [Pseudomonadota bacterium]